VYRRVPRGTTRTSTSIWARRTLSSVPCATRFRFSPGLTLLDAHPLTVSLLTITRSEQSLASAHVRLRNGVYHSRGTAQPHQPITPERFGHPKANSPPWKATNFRRATETHRSSRVSARVAITVTISWGVVSLRKSTVRSSSMRGRRLERRTAREPNEVGAAETIETFAVAQQHVEDAVLGERAAELGKTEIQGSLRWCVLPTFA